MARNPVLQGIRSREGSRTVRAEIRGLNKVIKRLRKLPERTQRKVMRPAIRKASTPLVRAARKLAPKGAGLKPDGTPRKHLKQTITKIPVKWYRNTNTFAIVIGPEKNKSPHSHLVHDGTAPHETPLSKPLILTSQVAVGKRRGGKPKLGTTSVLLLPGFVIKHPGARANPFLQRAVNSTQSVVRNTLSKEILAGIDKQVQILSKQT